MREVVIEPTFESWQAVTRALLREEVPPAEVTWRERLPARPDVTERPAEPPSTAIRVPRRFMELARGVAPHRDPARWALLYDILWRLVHGDPRLLEAGDLQVARLERMESEARDGLEIIGASPFVPPATALADLPPSAGLAELRAAAARCAGCDLYRHPKQTVFGQGPADARVVMVGEQPGDQEDRQGAPFVGPAGEVFDRALAEVGLERARIYVTNAVKHFKFVERGKRRIHQTPGAADIAACRPWVEAELALLKPDVLVCLGATAARALLGPAFRLMKEHGQFFATRWAPQTMATLHPSAVLRGEDETAQARLYAMLRDDLRLVAEVVSGTARPSSLSTKA